VISQTLKMSSSETTSFTDKILSERSSGSPLSECNSGSPLSECNSGSPLSECNSGSPLSRRSYDARYTNVSSGSPLSERSSGGILIEISNHENRDVFIQTYRSHCNRIDDESRHRLGYIAITFIVAIAVVFILYFCLGYTREIDENR